MLVDSCNNNEITVNTFIQTFFVGELSAGSFEVNCFII